MTGRKKHIHRWSRPYHRIFNGPVRVCLNGECGAMKYSSGRIVILRDGTKPKRSKEGQ